MVFIAFINVITRYFIKYPLAFTEELEVNLFVWLVLLGSALAFRKGSHLCMGFIYEKFSPRIRRVLWAISVILSVTFFAILMYWGISEVRDEIALDVRSESLEIPVYYYTISIPLISALIIFRIIQKAIQDYKHNSTRSES